MMLFLPINSLGASALVLWLTIVHSSIAPINGAAPISASMR
jgi:hypothetical protein